MNGDSINYSLNLLRRDRVERSHIIVELAAIKRDYKITSKTLLELGCGLGHNLEIFKEDNSVKGIEGLANVVSEARALGLDVVVGNLEHPLNLPDKSQDWIFCLDVLEHLEKPFNLMLEIRRILKPDGGVVLNVPNHLDLKGRIKLLLGSGLDVHKFFPASDDWDNPHLRFFTYSGFRRMVMLTGWRIVEDRSSHFTNFPLLGPSKGKWLTKLNQFLWRLSPALFSRGFFVVLQKDESADSLYRDVE